MKIFLNTFSRNYEEGYHQGVFPETEVKKEIDFGEVDRGKGLEKEIEEGFGGVKCEVEGKEEGKEERWNCVHPPLHPKSLSKKQKKMLPSKKRLAKAIDKINREFPFAGTRPKKRKNKSDLLSSHSQPKKKKSLKMIKQKLNKMIDQTLTSSKKLRNKKDQNEYPDIKPAEIPPKTTNPPLKRLKKHLPPSTPLNPLSTPPPTFGIPSATPSGTPSVPPSKPSPQKRLDPSPIHLPSLSSSPSPPRPFIPPHEKSLRKLLNFPAPSPPQSTQSSLYTFHPPKPPNPSPPNPQIKTEQPCCPDYTPTIKTEQEGIEEKLATGEVKGIEKLKNKGKDRNGIVEFVNNKGEIEYLCVSVQVLKKVCPQVLCEFYERVFRKVRRCYGVEV